MKDVSKFNPAIYKMNKINYIEKSELLDLFTIGAIYFIIFYWNTVILLIYAIGKTVGF